MTNGDDLAFPAFDQYNNVAESGLSKREYFAAMAMQGILANGEFLANHKDVDIHACAVKSADDLITELNKQP